MILCENISGNYQYVLRLKIYIVEYYFQDIYVHYCPISGTHAISEVVSGMSYHHCG
jgi:hypothetical protein